MVLQSTSAESQREHELKVAGIFALNFYYVKEESLAECAFCKLFVHTCKLLRIQRKFLLNSCEILEVMIISSGIDDIVIGNREIWLRFKDSIWRLPCYCPADAANISGGSK